MVDRVENRSVQTVDDIRSLEGLDAVRVMPGMYVGGTDERALHHLVYEVVDNSIDEIMAGRGDHCWVVIRDNGYISVIDNCGGIPVGVHKTKGVNTLTMVLTQLHAGAKFNDGTAKNAYKVSGGLHGVGVSAVNALSSHLVAEVRREGKLYRQEFECGKPTTEVTEIRDLEDGEGTGTAITFHPDMTILQTGDFKFGTIAQRLREMAYVTRGANLTLIDERDKPLPSEMSFFFEGGIRSFTRYLNRNRDAIHPVVGGLKDTVFNEGQPNEGLMTVEFGFQYTEGSSSSTELSFANHINTPDGGTHLTGLRTALTRVINNYARKIGILKDKDTNFSGRDTLEGLTAVVSIKHPSPQFESQTKTKLINPEIQGAVASVVADIFAQFMEEFPREARRIIEKCMNSMRIRDALEKQRELLTGRKSLLENTTLPGKLADCSERDPSKSELFIVEGDSAGGCFSGNTKVMLSSGELKSMLELTQDWDQGIQHFGFATNGNGDVRIVPLNEPRLTKRSASLVEVKLDNGETVKCTPDHLFRLRDGSYCAAESLQMGETLMSFAMHDSASGFAGAVTSVRAISERADVYDLTVDEYHNFALASGIFVHNSAKQGRDRHFQAILPLRGKILNTERARLNRILDSNEIKALISALGVGIGDDFNLSKLRYNRIVIMSVAHDEPTLVTDQHGNAEFVQIGQFIDDCVEGRRNYRDYQVMTFDQKTHETRFKPLKAVIRHPHEEAMYKLTTRYNRSVKVTSSHSVFVWENGQAKLKKGNEVREGDILVASRRLPRPATSPTHIDLLATFQKAGETQALYVQGEDVRRIASERTLSNAARPELWDEPRVILPAEQWQTLIAHREAHGISQKTVATAIGVKQPITISHWERGVNRPILSHFNNYLQGIAWNEPLNYALLPSKIEERLQQDDSSRNARWRKVSAYKLLSAFTDAEIAALGAEVKLVPKAHVEKAFARYLPITRELVWLLGWYVAEGTLSKHQISLNIGKKDAAFIPELTAAVEAVFGETPRCYHDPDSDAIKFYFQSVAAARLLRAWGLNKLAHHKKLPDVVFNLPEELQWAFLEGYFLGDGTLSDHTLAMTTTSAPLKDGLLYLLGQLGIVATHSFIGKQSNALIESKNDHYTISIGHKEQIERCRKVWSRHWNAGLLEEHLARPSAISPSYVSISDDLIGLKVVKAEEVERIGEYVYDFSVQDDENFICGVGGLCAHNTDADVDGAHIRTLLLTFLFRYMQPVIQNGHLYIAQPPIFRLEYKKQSKYFYPEAGVKEDALLSRALTNYPEPQKVQVSRYKGLGEMNPEQLWETTLDPARRTMLQVTIDDAAEADSIFTMLMGDEVPPRRKFITTHARDAKLDV